MRAAEGRLTEAIRATTDKEAHLGLPDRVYNNSSKKNNTEVPDPMSEDLELWSELPRLFTRVSGFDNP